MAFSKLRSLLANFLQLNRKNWPPNDPIYNLHHFPRDLLTSADHRELRQAATNMWREIACLKTA